MNHTLMALAAPCDLSTPSDPDLATSEGSSASNFILISYKRQKSTEAMIILGITETDLFTATKLRGIYGNKQSFYAPLISMLHESLGDTPVFVYIPIQ